MFFFRNTIDRQIKSISFFFFFTNFIHTTRIKEKGVIIIKDIKVLFFPFSRCNQTLYKYKVQIYIYIRYKGLTPRVILWTYLAIKFEDFYFTEKFCKEVRSPFGTLKFNATSYSFQKLADSWLNLAQRSKERIADCRNAKSVGER